MKQAVFSTVYHGGYCPNLDCVCSGSAFQLWKFGAFGEFKSSVLDVTTFQENEKSGSFSP